MRLTLPIFALLLAACADRAPKYRAASPEVTAYAYEADLALSVQEQAAQVLAWMEGRTGVATTRPVEVWQRQTCLADEERKLPGYYLPAPRRVVVGQLAQYDFGMVLVHELTHHLAHEPGSWIGELPGFLVEGLADYLGATASKTLDARLERAHEQVLDRPIDLQRLWELDRVHYRDRQSVDAYAVGLIAVHRIGIDNLRAAVERGELTYELILSAVASGSAD